MNRIDEFISFRQSMNKELLKNGNLEMKRFFALDEKTYQPGALDRRTKELLGLVASLVLRCDDCVSYHILQAVRAGVSRRELFEVFNVALVVGGSIVIPHLRRAMALLLEIESDRKETPAGAEKPPDRP